MNPKLTKLICALSITTLFVAGSSALAQNSMGNMPGMSGMGDMSQMDMPAKPMTGSGTGVIKSIDLTTGMVTIEHGPIPALKWPAMTMAFKANPTSLLTGLKAGQKVTFDVAMTGSDCTITAIQTQNRDATPVT